ncbi:MAG TPA: GntR family transcriptional regulator [Roseiarcus sp.]|nr:GntR family transcriptional regulator [Roseiarcus sp.]
MAVRADGTRKSRGEGRPKKRGAAKPAAHGATVGFIVESVREDILAGRLAPGERLVECDLTARFGVSRGPVREALRRLSAEGLIEHWPNRGALVRRLSQRAIGELFQIRIEIEALAARLAAESSDEAARAAFTRAIVRIFDDGEREPCAYLEENSAFHDAIIALAGNLHLRGVSTQLRLPLIMAQVGDALTREALKQSVAEHRDVAKAILARDARAAAAAMRGHLERAAALALARLDGKRLEAP